MVWTQIKSVHKQIFQSSFSPLTTKQSASSIKYALSCLWTIYTTKRTKMCLKHTWWTTGQFPALGWGFQPSTSERNLWRCVTKCSTRFFTGAWWTITRKFLWDARVTSIFIKLCNSFKSMESLLTFPTIAETLFRFLAFHDK